MKCCAAWVHKKKKIFYPQKTRRLFKIIWNSLLYFNKNKVIMNAHVKEKNLN
jgi:hypothetical protein